MRSSISGKRNYQTSISPEMLTTRIAGFRSLVVCCLLPALMFTITAISAAQSAWNKEDAPLNFDPAQQVRVGNNAISIGLNRYTGQFWIETNKGVPILFVRNNGLTCFSNFRFEAQTFTNNDLHNPQSPRFTVRMPFGNSTVLSDKLEFKTLLRVGGRSLECTQQFIPSLDSDYAFIRIRTVFKNTSAVPVRAGLQILYDLFIDPSDLVDVNIGSTIVDRERGWYGSAIPDIWEGTSSLKPIKIRGRFSDAGLLRPDAFIIGQWQYNGYLGAAAWDYQPSGLRFWDNAALMQWNEKTIQPGDSSVISTDYGYKAEYDAKLMCSAQAVRLGQDEKSYDPNPLEVIGSFVNTGSIAIPLMSLSLSLPPGAMLAPSEIPVKSTSAALLPGDTAKIPWQVIAPIIDSGGTLDFGMELVSPTLLRQQCAVRVQLPAIPHYTADLVCPDTIKTELTTDGKDYSNNPFQISTAVTNAGTAPLANLTAVITLPAELALQSGSASVLVSPNPLLPGQNGTASWQVLATPQTSELVVDYSVRVTFRTGVLASCNGHVLLREIVQDNPCVETSVTTKGTEFWTTFLLNDGGNTGVELPLYFSASKDTRVRIERPLLGRSDDIFVPAGGVRKFNIESTLNTMIPETVQRMGVHITSDNPIAVYSASLSQRHSDASIVLPVHALGMQYTTVGYEYADSDPEEHFVVLATENGTTITIDPFSMTSTRRPPRVPFTVTLNQGETYYVRSGIMGRFGGLTGSFISADRPVVVLSGAHTGWIPTNSRNTYGYLNPHFDQIIPDHLLGTEYIAVPFRSRLGGDTFKAVAIRDSTTISIGSVPVAMLAVKGDWYEFMLDTPSRIWSDKPFLLAQFANSANWDQVSIETHYGDASMVVLSPTDRMIQCHSFPVQLSYDTSFAPRFANSYVNMVVPDGGEKQLVMNGVAVPDSAFHPVPFSNYRSAQFALTNQINTVETADRRGTGAIVYGFEYHDAFTFNSGFSVEKKHGLTSVEVTAFPSAMTLDPVSPNPLTDVATIRYSLPQASAIDLAVYSSVGVRVLQLERGIREAGAHAVHLHASALAQGYYHIILSGNNARLLRNLAILR